MKTVKAILFALTLLTSATALACEKQRKEIPQDLISSEPQKRDARVDEIFRSPTTTTTSDSGTVVH